MAGAVELSLACDLRYDPLYPRGMADKLRAPAVLATRRWHDDTCVSAARRYLDTDGAFPDFVNEMYVQDAASAGVSAETVLADGPRL
jgi:hypothetical protein